jgi:hypothetical protein
MGMAAELSEGAGSKEHGGSGVGAGMAAGVEKRGAPEMAAAAGGRKKIGQPFRVKTKTPKDLEKIRGEDGYI